MQRVTSPFIAALLAALFTALAADHGYRLSNWMLLGAATAGTLIACSMTMISHWLKRPRRMLGT